MVFGIIAVIIFLSILILVHELGHFLAAKKFGLLVEEFGFGLPPRLWGKKIGGTIYSINALPFGGFVRIYGEDRGDEPAIEPNGEISITEAQEKIVVSDGKLSIDEKIITEKISTIVNSRSFNSISVWRRAVITFSGVVMNFLFGWLVLSLVLSIGAAQAIVITQVSQNSPAQSIGLQVGDKIVGFNDIRSSSGNSDVLGSDSFIKFTNENKGKEITLKIERNGQIQEFSITPRINPPADEGALGIGLIEIGAPKQNIFYSVWDGLKTSIQIIGLVFSTIFNLIVQLFSFHGVNLEQVAGPVGIVKVTAQAENLGFSYLLQLLALISLNLVVINIFPFPALDGGRLLFLLIEKIKGSPLPVKFERYANAAGMTILLLLMVAITVRDIIKF